MYKRLFYPAGIAVVILVLLLVCGVFQGRRAENTAVRTGAASAGTEKSDDGESENTMSDEKQTEKKSDYIKWVEFNVSYEALNSAYTYDVETYQEEIHLDWIELLAYLGAKYGGDFRQYKESDMTEIAEKLLSGEATMSEITADMQYYGYYREAYGAVLDGMVGEYRIEKPAEVSTSEEAAGSGKKEWKKYYGLKAYSPIAKTFPYTDYDDFGVSRSYGYQRNHLGHDMMGQVGTPRRIICRT